MFRICQCLAQVVERTSCHRKVILKAMAIKGKDVHYPSQISRFNEAKMPISRGRYNKKYSNDFPLSSFRPVHGSFEKVCSLIMSSPAENQGC